jgi:hypothetical protein
MCPLRQNGLSRSGCTWEAITSHPRMPCPLLVPSLPYADSFTRTSAIWNRTPSLTYTEYTARCCDLLEAHSKLRGDQTLVWQVRLQRFVEEANTLCRIQRGHSQSEYQISLMIRGMETELAEYETRMPPEIAATRMYSTTHGRQ